MQQRSGKKGIVLVTTMLSVVLVIMLLSAVVYSNMGSLRLTSNFYDRETALMAADSGMQYAVTRLQKDITWRAIDKYSLKPAQTKSILNVEEENGNVVGTVTLANGRRAAFRIKFNYEDGDAGLDTMKNSSKPLDMVNVSTNNLFSTASSEAVIADKNGKVAVKDGKPVKVEVKDSAGHTYTYPFPIPKQTCRLVVQGLAGTGVRDADPKDLHAIDKLTGSVTPVCVECYLAIDTENMYTDAVTCSGGKLTAESETLFINQAKGAVGSNIRSLKNVDIKINKLTYDTGKIYAHSGISVIENKKDVSGDYKGGTINNKDSFPELKWEDVPKADSKSPRITAGTYVWEQPKGSDTPHLMFYQGTYKSVSDLKGKGQPATLPATVSLDANSMSLTISGDTYINGDFVLLSKTKNRPSIGFLSDSANSVPILTSKGEMVVKGTMVGAGALTSEGNITIQGPSVLESTPDVGVSIYSNKDINIVEIDKTSKKYEDSKKKKGPGQASFIPDENAEYSDDGFIQCGGTPQTAKEKYMAELEAAAKTYFVEQGAHEECTHCIHLYNDMIHELISNNFSPETADIDMTPPSDCNRLNSNPALYQAVKARAISDYGLIYNFEEEDPELSAEFNADNIDEAVQAYEEANPAVSSAAKRDQLMALISHYQSLKYTDLDISGVLYAMGNINIEIKGTLNVTGSVIAYGDSGNSGNISMKAGKIGLISDPAYINNLLALSKVRQLKKGLYCTY